MQFLGTLGRMEIQYPVNPPSDQPSHILIDEAKGPAGTGVVSEAFEYADQFTIQGDLLSKAIRENGEVAVPIEDSLRNIAVMEAVFRSAESAKWERPQDFL
jgi:hypothetical protein